MDDRGVTLLPSGRAKKVPPATTLLNRALSDNLGYSSNSCPASRGDSGNRHRAPPPHREENNSMKSPSRRFLPRFSCLLFVFGALLFAHPIRAADDMGAATARASEIANRLQAALDPDQQGRVTMAASILEGGTIVIATSEKGSFLRSPVKDIQRELRAEVADGPAGCAERKIITYVRSNLFLRNKRILVVAAGRPICELCEPAIVAAGAKPASPCKSGRNY